MFEGWGEYYLLVGGGSGALIGLLFVVVTLTSSVERAKVRRGNLLYITPTLYHFAAVLTVSALALAPRLPSGAIALILGAGGLYGCGYAVFILIGIRRPAVPEAPHWTDQWCYGVFPAIAYLGLLGAGVTAWFAPQCAPYVLAPAAITLLLVAIRNAWDLVTWLAPRSGEPALQEAPTPPPRPGPGTARRGSPAGTSRSSSRA